MPGTGNGRKQHWMGGAGEIEFNIKSNLKKKLSFRQAVLYTFGQDCSTYQPSKEWKLSFV